MGEPAPSLLLARTYSQQAQHAQHGHLNHLRQHDHNRRQTDDSFAIATAQPSVITQVTATVSYVQQIDVDSEGHTFSILSLLTSDALQAILTDPASSTTPTITGPSSAASGAVSTAASNPSETNSSSSQSTSLSSPSAPTTNATFTSLHTSSNSTTSISSSNSLSHTSAQSSTLSSSLSSSSASLTSSTSSSSTDGPLETSPLSYSSTFATTSIQSTLAGVLGGAAGGTPTTTGGATSSSAASGNDASSGVGPNMSTSAVVGGVVGSVAGVAVIAMLLLMLVKWKKHRSGVSLSLGNGRDGAGDAGTAARGAPPRSHGGMAERRSYFAVPAAFANLAGRSSKQIDQTTSSTGTSERGFYRVSGRKLPSALQTGGDGYGDDVPDERTPHGTSFYPDSEGFYGGPGSPSSPSETHREHGQIGTPILRPSPARTPVTEQGPFSTPLIPDLDPIPPRPYILGRSYPSQDGSHASRFIEEV